MRDVTDISTQQSAPVSPRAAPATTPTRRIAAARANARWGIAVCLLLALLAGSWSVLGSARLGDVIYADKFAKNILFDSDPATTVAQLTDRESRFQMFTNTHPLYSALTYPAAFVLRTAFGLGNVAAVRVVNGGVAALWTAAIFLTIWLVTGRLLDTAIFTLLGISSASVLFWTAIPVPYILGSVTMLGAIALAGIAQRRTVAPTWWVVSSALALSITVTNWMAGIAATLVTRGLKRTLSISAYALLAVTLAWSLVKRVFPEAQFFLTMTLPTRFIGASESGGPLVVTKAFFLDSFVLPALQVLPGATSYWYLPVLSVQHSTPGTGTPFGLPALFLWIAILLVGAVTLIRFPGHQFIRGALSLTLLGQFALHLVFGTETFVHSAHFLPLLIVLAAFGSVSRFRIPVLAATCLAIVLALPNNLQQFERTAEYVSSRSTVAYSADRRANERLNEPHVRSVGHVLLAMPGSATRNKGYIEPGGGFSPAVGSFGISLWMLDEQGSVVATSDRLDASLLRQSFSWPSDSTLPSVVNETPYYSIEWSVVSAGHYRGRMLAANTAGLKTAVVVRGVGPAGGPIASLRWSGSQLSINDRWVLETSVTPAAVVLGSENNAGWMSLAQSDAEWSGSDGYGFARIGLPHDGPTIIDIVDTQYDGSPDRPLAGTFSPIQMELPDARYGEGLAAQLAHILPGLVQNETRPGDPMNYSESWLHDEIRIVLALARAGQADVARQVAVHLAENDTFGSFGTMGDEEGLAIDALVQLMHTLDDGAFDRVVWPHVQRKATTLLNRLETPSLFPVDPDRESALPATLRQVASQRNMSEGGRLLDPYSGQPDWYINRVGYRGLTQAAAAASRVGARDDSLRYWTGASQLAAKWSELPASRSERTLDGGTTLDLEVNSVLRMRSALSWDANASDRVGDVLAARRSLRSGSALEAWTIISRLWVEQDAPGLYSWSDRGGLGASFDSWNAVRGWLNRSQIAPHYGLAADVAALIIDMFVMQGDEPGAPLVIGAGVPSPWISEPMRVTGVHTTSGVVSWHWDGKQMLVEVQGKRPSVVLGSSFPHDVPVIVQYRD